MMRGGEGKRKGGGERRKENGRREAKSISSTAGT